MKEAVIILTHGSKREAALDALEGLTKMVGGNGSVKVAHMQFASPTLDDVFADLLAQGYKKAIVMPLFLLAGEHVTNDVPAIVTEAVCRHPQLNIRIAPHLGIDHHIAGSVLERLAAVRDVVDSKEGQIPVMTGPEIEHQSLQIIERLLPDLEGDHGYLIKRMVHSAGDVSIASSVRMSGDALSAGLEALHKGLPVITDVRMVKAGIDSKKIKKLGSKIVCGLSNSKRKTGNITRTAYGIRECLKTDPEAVVVIGNAPTALDMVLDMADNNEIKPGLIIGIPVGFIGAAESKDRLIASTLPHITVKGIRGGSALAVSAINSLLRLATEGI